MLTDPPKPVRLASTWGSGRIRCQPSACASCLDISAATFVYQGQVEHARAGTHATHSDCFATLRPRRFGGLVLQKKLRVRTTSQMFALACVDLKNPSTARAGRLGVTGIFPCEEMVLIQHVIQPSGERVISPSTVGLILEQYRRLTMQGLFRKGGSFRAHGAGGPQVVGISFPDQPRVSPENY